MGVEFEIRCSKCKERVILYKLREAFEPVRRIIDGSLEPISHSDWLDALTGELSLWQVKQALKFTQRHHSCELLFWNDHADFDEEGRYYPEMDEDSPLPRTEEFEANMKEKSRLYVEDGFITNRYSLPYDYNRREDLIVKIPCEGPVQKLIQKYMGQGGIDGEWGEQVYVEYILTTEDGRLFKYTPMGTFGEFITPEELEAEIDKFTENPRIDFKVVELEEVED